MKKILAIVLAIAMLLSLAACSSGDKSSAGSKSGEKTTLSVWMAPRGDGREDDATFWKEMFAPFEEENNCTIDVTIIPWDNFDTKVMSGFSSGMGPDICYMYNEMLYDYINLELIEPLDNYLTAEEKENYLHLDMGVYNSKQYTMPTFVGEPRVLFYNNTLLQEMGLTPPATWDEFIETCLKIKELRPDLQPYMQAWNTAVYAVLNENFWPQLWTAGGDLMDFDGTVKLLDGDEALTAAQFIYDLRFKYDIIPEDCAGYSGDDIFSMFGAGQSVFWVGNVNNATYLRENGLDAQFVHFPGYGTADNWKTMDGADCLVMNAASKQKELSWKLLQHITGPTVMEQVHQRLASGMPLTKGEKNLMSEETSALYEGGSHMILLPVAKNSVAVMTNLVNNLQLMMMGDVTPEQALQNVVDYSKTLSD